MGDGGGVCVIDAQPGGAHSPAGLDLVHYILYFLFCSLWCCGCLRPVFFPWHPWHAFFPGIFFSFTGCHGSDLRHCHGQIEKCHGSDLRPCHGSETIVTGQNLGTQVKKRCLKPIFYHAWTYGKIDVFLVATKQSKIWRKRIFALQNKGSTENRQNTILYRESSA